MTPPEATNVAAEVLKRWLPAAKRYDGREYFLVMEMLPFLDLTTGFDQMVVLVQTAKNGDPDADGLLHRLGGMFVSAGAPIPEPLRSYIAERLRYETNPIAVADAAGGDWPERGRKSAIYHTRRAPDETLTSGVELLSHIREAFGGEAHIATTTFGATSRSG